MLLAACGRQRRDPRGRLAVGGRLYNGVMPERLPSPPSSWPARIAVAIQPVSVPEAAPPYDDAVPSRAPQAGLTPAPAPAGTSTLGSGGPTEGWAAGPWPSRFAQVLAETLAGSRPPRQLAPWTTEQTRKRISQLSATLATAHQPRLRRVIVRSPADGVVEMTMVVWLGTRACALAVRLERDDPSAPPEPTDPAGLDCRGPGLSWPAARELKTVRRGPSQPPPPGQDRPEPVAGRTQPGWVRPASAAAPRGQAPRWYCTAIEAA